MTKRSENTATREYKPVNIRDLATAMMEIIEEGNRDVKTNVKALAEKLGRTELTVKQKIRDAKFKYPQLRLLDLSFFVATPGKRKKEVNEDEMNEFFAELLEAPMDEVEAGVEEAKVAIQEDLEKREEKRRRREESEAETSTV